MTVQSNSPFNETWNPAKDGLQPRRWRNPRIARVEADIFDESVPFDFIDQVFAVMALCPQHTFQVLTKRPERMAEYSNTPDRHNSIELEAEKIKRGPACFGGKHMLPMLPLPNVWLGTPVENQQTADARIPHLLTVPAAVRFLSMEPLLGPVDLRLGQSEGEPTLSEPFRERAELLHWVIVGGESGPGARPCNVDSIRSVVRQCAAAGVPCFVKQLGANPVIDDTPPFHGEFPIGTRFRGVNVLPRDPKGGDMSEWPEDLRVRQMPVVSAARKGAGK